MTRSLRHIAPRRSAAAEIPGATHVVQPRSDGAAYRILRLDSPRPLPDETAEKSEEESLLEAMQECSRMLNGDDSIDHRNGKRQQRAKPAERDSRLCPKPSGGASTGTRIRLRLSSELVKILFEFRKAGRNPRDIVESSLWNDERIRDAAAILRLN